MAIEPDTIPCPPPDEYDLEIVFEDPEATSKRKTLTDSDDNGTVEAVEMTIV
jgi:hypothetical protein